MWNFDNFSNDDAETMMELFNYCSDEYHAKLEHCRTICDTAGVKERFFDEKFREIPGFVPGQHCIVFKKSRLREINPAEIENFFNYLYLECREECRIEGKTRDDWWEIYNDCSRVIDTINSMIRNRKCTPNLFNYHEIVKITNMMEKAKQTYSNMKDYTEASAKQYDRRIRFANIMTYYANQFLNEEVVEQITAIYPELKATVGQKTSKLVNKWLTKEGLKENQFEFEKHFAKYADAVNPLEIPELVVISWNKFDFLTMSFGNCWTSCHSIDKENVHEYEGRAAEYEGCWSSGTMSYMLDMSSLVMYSLDPKTAHIPYWNEPKLRRQMFHINKSGNTIIQGRLYPDDQSDCGCHADASMYKPWREVVQEIISRAFNIPNFWNLKKGTEECDRYTTSQGTHYRDYLSYSNCNVSVNRSCTERERVEIGHNPICPSCGKVHGDRDWCTCYNCRENDGEEYHVCADCGRTIRYENDEVWINGECYCTECCTYCEYHEAYEREDMTYIDGFGNICDDGIEAMLYNEDLYRCEECGDYVLYRNVYDIEDHEGENHHFCCERCRTRFVDNHAEMFINDEEEAE